jgi:hypothetical protein
MMLTRQAPTSTAFSGLLRGLRPGSVQTWGPLEVVGLFPVEACERAQFVAPFDHLKLVRVRSYGTLELLNTAERGLLVAPMHVGFFQAGAQNHATCRALVLDAGETLVVTDCFCIQQSQGGLLKEAQNRFLMLPLALRRTALAKRGVNEFGRLWQDIDRFTRSYGVARGGHFERFLRPNFARLQRYRHGLEPCPGQVGAAYFVAGQLVGVEVAPNAAYWLDLSSVLAIYGYGPSALLATQHRLSAPRPPLDLDGLADLDDLAGRLESSRGAHRARLLEAVRQEVDVLSGGWVTDERRHGLDVRTLLGERWAGQHVQEEGQTVYLSVFSDFSARTFAPHLASKK